MTTTPATELDALTRRLIAHTDRILTTPAPTPTTTPRGILARITRKA